MASEGGRSRWGRGPWAVLLVAVLLAAGALYWRLRLSPEDSPAAAGQSEVGPVQRPGEEAQPRAADERAVRAAVTRVLEQVRAEQGAESRAGVEGEVLSSVSGAGIPGAEVVFFREGAALSARTDAAGRFRFDADQEGAYRLAAVSAPDFHPFAPEWGHSGISVQLVRGQRVKGLKLTLAPRVDLQGRVEDGSGQPVAGATVRVLGDAVGSQALLGRAVPVVSGPDGRFVFQAPEEAMVVASHPDYAPGAARVDLAASVSRSLVVRLGPKRSAAVALESISGRVVDERGEGLGSALVSAAGYTRGARGWESFLSAQVETQPDGRFSLTGLEPGQVYGVSAELSGTVPVRRQVRAGARNLELKLMSGGRLAGRVVDSRGQPVSSFTVVLSGVVGPLERAGERAQTVVSADGRFLLEGVAPGHYAVAAVAWGLAPSEEQRAEVARGSTAEVTLVLSVGGEVFGQVVDRETKKALSGARVYLEGVPTGDEGEPFPTASQTRTDAEGRFRLTGVPRGPRSLAAVAPEHHGRILSGLEVKDGERLGPLAIDLAPVAKGESPRVELVGIGAVLSARGDALLVQRVMPGGGAHQAGMVDGDEIVEVEGRKVTEQPFARWMDQIRGPEGSAVRLTVRRAGQLMPLTVMRRRISG